MISLWIGMGLGAGLVAWVLADTPGALNLLSPAAISLVIGGTIAAVIIQCSITNFVAAVNRAAKLLIPSRIPTVDATIAEAVRLAKKAQSEGGLLALQGEGENFADGFLARAIAAGVSAGETAEVRRIMEADLRQLRQERLQEAEVFEVAAGAAPILGLMGTLLGMVRVVAAISEPGKMGPAMAVALSSDFVALGLSQLICAPLSGRLVAGLRQELLVREILLEGVIGIVGGRPAYRIELHLTAYSRRQQRRQQQAAPELRAQRAGA